MTPMAGSRSRSISRLLLLTVKPLGRYMTDVFEGKRTFLSAVLRPVERVIYCGLRREARARSSTGRL